MITTRRRFGLGMASVLAGGALPLGLSRPTVASVTENRKVLRAAPATVQLAPAEYAPTPVWSYEGSVPGPVIRARKGQTLDRRFVNDLPEPSTVHWHGIRIDNAMDGVPGLTQPVVQPGAHFDYRFTLPDAGTYWYHPHHRTWEQLARGLHGVLVVEEDGDPQYDREEILVLDDWRFDRDATLHESFGAPMDRSHAGRLGNWVTVNGQDEPSIPVKQHERLRLRLVNAATARVFNLRMKGGKAWIAALDGQALDRPKPLPDRFRFAPAQRVDLIFDILDTGEAVLAVEERGETVVLAGFPVDGVARSDPFNPPEPLPPNDLPELKASGDVLAADLVMAGGAMGQMRSAVLNGTEQSLRDIAQQGYFWAFNGVVGMTDTPLLKADLGRLVTIKMVNETNWPHAIHLHGHHFRKLGGPDGLGPWRDTELIERGETAEIAFIADNPGKWMLHCHMVDHADSGMMTWIEVG